MTPRRRIAPIGFFAGWACYAGIAVLIMLALPPIGLPRIVAIAALLIWITGGFYLSIIWLPPRVDDLLHRIYGDN